ncbi:MAG: hypothetical protein ACRC0V_09040 [Fusobacteriaceae bacterium]
MYKKKGGRSLKKYKIKGTRKYQLHRAVDEKGFVIWNVFSLRNMIYLKDTVAFGKENLHSLKRLVGVVFDDGERKKMYIKDIIKLKGVKLHA